MPAASATAASGGSAGNWSELDPDLLWMILQRLILADNIRFGAVCTRWYSIAAENRHPPAPQLPYLLVPDDSAASSGELFRFLDLAAPPARIHLPPLAGSRLVGSSAGRLIYSDDHAELHALDPLAGSQTDLPSITTFNDIIGTTEDPPGKLNGYVFLLLPYRGWREVSFMVSNFIRKVILCAKTGIAVVIYTLESKRSKRVAMCRPGDESWTQISCDDLQPAPFEYFLDAIFYNNALYAVNMDGIVISSDLQLPEEFTLVGSSMGEEQAELEKFCAKYLVEVSGDLLQVWRRVVVVDNKGKAAGGSAASEGSKKVRETLGFRVFRMNWESNNWDEVKSIGDYAVFVGLGESVSLPASKFPALKPNSIYFTDEYNFSSRSQHTGDMGIYSLEDGSVVEEFSWGDLNMSWTPPIWFMPLLCSLLGFLIST